MAEEKTESKKSKKLSKDLATEPGVVIITVEGGKKGPMKFPFATLPENIRKNFGPFGLGHKLGDAAAGRKGEDAEASIMKVWEGLMKGDWTVRAPAAPKISVTEVASKFSALPKAEQAVAKKLLEGLGIAIPGIE